MADPADKHVMSWSLKTQVLTIETCMVHSLETGARVFYAQAVAYLCADSPGKAGNGILNASIIRVGESSRSVHSPIRYLKLEAVELGIQICSIEQVYTSVIVDTSACKATNEDLEKRTYSSSYLKSFPLAATPSKTKNRPRFSEDSTYQNIALQESKASQFLAWLGSMIQQCKSSP